MQSNAIIIELIKRVSWHKPQLRNTEKMLSTRGPKGGGSKHKAVIYEEKKAFLIEISGNSKIRVSYITVDLN